jgi:DNA-3-methyladenine glycosylase II
MKKALAHLRSCDPVLAPWIDQIGPFKMQYRDPNFSTLVRSIVSQQVSGAAARTVYGRLEELVKGRVEPKALLKLGAEKLQPCGLSGQKTKYILNLAEATASRRVVFERFGEMGDQEIIENLTQVKGIGVWTVQMYLMFALRRPNVLPVGDLGVRAGFKKVHELEELPTPRELAEYGSRWSPYSSVASWYLWRSLDSMATL